MKEALTVRCPHCDAAPNSPCVFEKRVEVPLFTVGDFHFERADLALKMGVSRTDQIVSEITAIIVAHLETMPESERKKRLAAFRDTVIIQKPHIKQNRFGGDLIEYGVIDALFEDIPASEVGVTSGAQSAFNAARAFITGIIANQCRLAGCKVSGIPYDMNDVHTDECWFGIRRNFYMQRRAKYSREQVAAMGVSEEEAQRLLRENE
jgi:hypothetical protein